MAEVRFAFVVPVYNHGARLAEVVAGLRPYGLPVFVVDDGSTDETRQVLAMLADVLLLRHAENRGKGAALLTGFRAAAAVADFAVSLDADGQHDPRDCARLISRARAVGRGLVIGRRQGMRSLHTPWTSRFGRGFSNFWVRAAGGPRIGDSQSGFRAYPLPDVLRWGVRARRFQFEVEILAQAAWRGVPIVEEDVSVRYEPDRTSHFRPFVDFCRNSGTFSRLIATRLLVPRTRRARLREDRL